MADDVAAADTANAADAQVVWTTYRTEVGMGDIFHKKYVVIEAYYKIYSKLLEYASQIELSKCVQFKLKLDTDGDRYIRWKFVDTGEYSCISIYRQRGIFVRRFIVHIFHNTSVLEHTHPNSIEGDEFWGTQWTPEKQVYHIFEGSDGLIHAIADKLVGESVRLLAKVGAKSANKK